MSLTDHQGLQSPLMEVEIPAVQIGLVKDSKSANEVEYRKIKTRMKIQQTNKNA